MDRPPGHHDGRRSGVLDRPATEICRIRRKEAAASATLLGADYTCLCFRNLTIAHCEQHKRIVTGLLRAVRPDVLITHPPVDYMADHEQTSYLARDAAFGSTIPNWQALPPIGVRSRKALPPCEALPALLFADPIDLATPDGSRARAQYVVDISPVPIRDCRRHDQPPADSLPASRDVQHGRVRRRGREYRSFELARFVRGRLLTGVRRTHRAEPSDADDAGPFPDQRGSSSYASEMDDLGGVDICYGGIGWCGHIAFWESDLAVEFGEDLGGVRGGRSTPGRTAPDDRHAERTTFVRGRPGSAIAPRTLARPDRRKRPLPRS